MSEQRMQIISESIVDFWDTLGLVPKVDDARPVEELPPDDRPAKRMRVGKPAGWADFKDDIYQLYAVKNYSIEELMDAMQKKGLQASRRTYMKRITEWGFQKKIRRSEKEAMLAIERRRSALGKRTNFRIRGQIVTAAKLKRVAAANEDEDNEAASPTRADTPSCISYDSPPPSAQEDEDAEAEPTDTPLMHTASWAEDPSKHFWRTRSAMGAIGSAPTKLIEEPVLVDNVLTYGLTPLEEPQRMPLPFAYEGTEDLRWFNVGASEPEDEEEDGEGEADYDSDSASDSGSDSGFQAGDAEPAILDLVAIAPPVAPPRPFKLRKYMASTLPSLNYEHRRTTIDMRLESGTRQLIQDDPDRPAEAVPVGDYCRPEDEEKVEDHLRLFRDAVAAGLDDDVRNQHFSDVLGILKSKYDREQATLRLMGSIFAGQELATEEQVRDKLEALLDHAHRHHGFEAQQTLDACLAGIILMLDATRIDMEQQTWNQAHVRGRLDRVRQLFNRVFAVFLAPETTLELMGDEEARDVTGPQRADDEGRAKAARMMADIADGAAASCTLLHTLELLPRYHKQWAGWHIQEQVQQKPSFLFTAGKPMFGPSSRAAPPPPPPQQQQQQQSSSFFGMPTTGGAFM